MGSFKNVSGMALYVPGIGNVDDGEIVENVPDDKLYQYTASANFEPVGAVSEELHAQAVEEEERRVADVAEAVRAGQFFDHPEAGQDDVAAPEESSAPPAGDQGEGQVVSGDGSGQALPPVEQTAGQEQTAEPTAEPTVVDPPPVGA